MSGIEYPFRSEKPVRQAGIFEAEIDALCVRLQALKAPRESKKVRGYFLRPDAYNGLLQATTFDEECPEELELLRSLVMDAAAVMDGFFAKAALEAQIGLRDKHAIPRPEPEYARVVSYAIEGGLEWALQDRADEFREAQPASPFYPHEHFDRHRR